mmetsp:Transcript_83856/g.237112  ORF Transcript_83856/g.237112 Transcript_83856/m.237112 type:complete len:290 (+) Transcript_83856:522-1391(+)
MSELAMMSMSSSWNTPITTCCAPAALVSGPRMLKTERTPSALRMGTTIFMAGWFTGANMKPIPHCATHSPTFSAVRAIEMPRASSTSAEPHCDETDRLPALAVLQPQAAARSAAAVEILMVCAPSPPVPTMSSILPSTATGTHASFIAATKPATSAGVSPFRRMSMRHEATWIWSAPCRMAPQTSFASSLVRLSPATSFSMYGLSDGALGGAATAAEATATLSRFQNRSPAVGAARTGLARVCDGTAVAGEAGESRPLRRRSQADPLGRGWGARGGGGGRRWWRRRKRR